MRHFSLLPLLLFFGCVSMAKKPLLPGDVAKLRPGKTTRPEIVKIYGKPQKEGLADKDINICYLYVEAGRAQILFLKFDVRDLLVEAALDNLQAKSACGDLIPEGHGVGAARQQLCFIDIDCGSGAYCKDGVCIGGHGRPRIEGRCETGHSGRSYCTHNGEQCFTSSDCAAKIKPP